MARSTKICLWIFIPLMILSFIIVHDMIASAYDMGYIDGYDNGYDDGYDEGMSSGEQYGREEAVRDSYESQSYDDGRNMETDDLYQETEPYPEYDYKYDYGYGEEE